MTTKKPNKLEFVSQDFDDQITIINPQDREISAHPRSERYVGAINMYDRMAKTLGIRNYNCKIYNRMHFGGKVGEESSKEQ